MPTVKERPRPLQPRNRTDTVNAQMTRLSNLTQKMSYRQLCDYCDRIDTLLPKPYSGNWELKIAEAERILNGGAS